MNAQSSFASAVTPTTRMSDGMYRLPYADGTTVKVTADERTHDPVDRYDLRGVDGDDDTYRVAASAPGEVRVIEDSFSANRPDRTPCNNNYVWIRHDNGEWTKYTHFRKGTVTGLAQLKTGDRVESGQLLGLEGKVGCAHGQHLHFEVAAPQNSADPDPIDNEGRMIGRQRIARVCGLPERRLRHGEHYVAKAMPAIDVFEATIDLGATRIGTTRSASCTVMNLDDVVRTIVVPASPPGSRFTWFAHRSAVAPGATTTFSVHYTPDDLLPDSSPSLRINGTTPSGSTATITVALRGRPTSAGDPPPTPVGRVDVRPRMLLMGQASPGTTRRQRVTVKNLATSSPTLIFVRPPAGGAPFHWTAEDVTIPAAGETFIDVVFAPVTRGRFSATLQIESFNGDIHRIPISGATGGF